MNRPLRQSMVWLALVFWPCLVLAQQASAPRIGYVDMKRLLDQAPQVQYARAQLQTEFATRDTSLEAAQQKLDGLKSALKADHARLSPSQIKTRQRDIDTLANSVERARKKMQQDLKSDSDQALQRSWQQISNAAVEYARSHGYDLLLPSPVIYASPKVDITDAILDRLRQQFHKDHPK